MHDRDEWVLPRSYAMESQPRLTVIPDRKDAARFGGGYKKRASVSPRRTELPEPSYVLPCNQSQRYSRNLCWVEHGWGAR